ncbi:MAG: GNAT family N-acetyltransferase [Provencibacterium sp.]|nr:GNAT family N-acetyltransferase [Provencibacterium sp.]
MNPFVELKEINKDNIDEVLGLKVSTEQSNFVQTTAHSLAKAWAFKNTAFPFAVYADNTMVGFIMLGYYEPKNQYTVWQFLIDERYQHQGYGKAALKLGIQFLKDGFDASEVYLGIAFQNTLAKKLYSSFGFVETGETTDTAFEMKLTIGGK